jgi:uncharacterized iron-regulated membrane protein
MTRTDPTPIRPAASALYRTLWRWHFYAGLFVLPFVLILSLTGAVYLFKPQTDRWEERAFHAQGHGQGMMGVVSADDQLKAALAANPGARLQAYRLPLQPGDAAMIQLGLADGKTSEVFVSPQGTVLGAIEPESRISRIVSLIHGSLLLGQWGDWLIELAASWTIVMILTGLYMWWPRPFTLAGTLWPRLSLRGRPLLKDLHRVTGFWIAGLVLVMLASGLPWAGAWGSAFQMARTQLGLVQGVQDWKTSADDGHAHHGTSDGSMATPMPPMDHGDSLPLSVFVGIAQTEEMAPPVMVIPPHAPQRFGPPTTNVWTVKSETQNRPLTRQVTYDPAMAVEVSRSGFSDRHVIDRIVNTGIAWHEGQLFGLANQLLGLFTAIALIAISILGVLMWLRRRPAATLAAPPAVRDAVPRGLIAAMIVAGLLLPLFGASVLLIWASSRILRRSQRL